MNGSDEEKVLEFNLHIGKKNLIRSTAKNRTALSAM